MAEITSGKVLDVRVKHAPTLHKDKMAYGADSQR